MEKTLNDEKEKILSMMRKLKLEQASRFGDNNIEIQHHAERIQELLKNAVEEYYEYTKLHPQADTKQPNSQKKFLFSLVDRYYDMAGEKHHNPENFLEI